MQAALDGEVALEAWKNAARVANNLSELTLALGGVRRATALGNQSVVLADRSGDGYWRVCNRTVQGNEQRQHQRLSMLAFQRLARPLLDLPAGLAEPPRRGPLARRDGVHPGAVLGLPTTQQEVAVAITLQRIEPGRLRLPLGL